MKKTLIFTSIIIFGVGLIYVSSDGFSEDSINATLKKEQIIKDATKQSVIGESKEKNIPMAVVKRIDTIDIDTVSSRQKFYDKLVKKDTKYIYALWVEILDTPQRRKLNLISDALAWKLQHAGDKKTQVYEELTELYTYSEFKNQMILTNLFGRISTPESTTILLNKLVSSSGSDIDNAIYDAIDTSVTNLWDGKFRTELSEPLENIWNNETKDMKFLSNIGNSIAKIGSKSGTKLLISKMKNYTLEELKTSKDNQAIVAFNALGKVTNPDSIDVLSDSMVEYNDDSAILYGKINALASQRNVIATKALLHWAKTTHTKSTALVNLAFSKLSDRRSLELVKKSLSEEHENYKNPNVREIIEDILENKTLGSGHKPQIKR